MLFLKAMFNLCLLGKKKNSFETKKIHKKFQKKKKEWQLQILSYGWTKRICIGQSRRGQFATLVFKITNGTSKFEAKVGDVRIKI